MDSEAITVKELAERDFIISELTEVLERKAKRNFRTISRIKPNKIRNRKRR